MNEIVTNITHIQERIDQACLENGRDPGEVKLLLATKTVPAERIRIALEAGYTLIAENKVQELKEKYEALKEIPHTNHFIGHLQTNKIKDLLRCDVSCIHSIDRLDLAEKLHQRLRAQNRTMEVLIQVNTSGEESKFGAAPEQVTGLVKQVAQLETLSIKGLMTIGLFSANTEKVRKCFRMLKQIQQDLLALKIPGVAMQELSMGMSGDLETAIAEGATIVRVGTAIFGQRSTPDSYYWNEKTIQQLRWPEVQEKLKGTKVALVDVRTEEKHQHSPIGGKNIPIDQLDQHTAELESYDEVIFYCTTGNKSTRAAEMAQELLPGIKVYSLINGVSSLKDQ